MKFFAEHVLRAAGIFFAFLFAFALACAFLYGCLVPRRYAEEVRLYARQAGLEEELVFAVIRAESNFRADAVSPAGAVGLMQIMPQTALFVEGLSGRRLDVRDPAENIDLGTAYLRYLFGRFSSLTQVLAAYNAGEGTVRAWLSRADLTDQQGDLAHIPYPETARYVRRVKIFYNCYKFCYR